MGQMGGPLQSTSRALRKRRADRLPLSDPLITFYVGPTAKREVIVKPALAVPRNGTSYEMCKIFAVARLPGPPYPI